MFDFFEFTHSDIGEPPWKYEFIKNLNASEYPKYLKKIFEYRTGKKLNLKHPKSFNEKIQWLKLYGATPKKTKLTDKVLVRDWVKEKIENEYLKPVLQICRSFDDIDFSQLPNSFVIKCNNGCKWHFIIKNKKECLDDTKFFQKMKEQIIGWLEQEFWVWGCFEMQYKGIEPKILIEPLMRDSINIVSEELQVYCFNGEPKYIVKQPEISSYNFYEKNLKTIDEIKDKNELLAVKLSSKLSNNINFVRVDWMKYQDKIYFGEMTFTPYSGFAKFKDEKCNIELGKLIKI